MAARVEKKHYLCTRNSQRPTNYEQSNTEHRKSHGLSGDAGTVHTYCHGHRLRQADNLGPPQSHHRRPPRMPRHGRNTLLPHTGRRMGRRGAQDEAGRHHHRGNLRILEPHRGTGGPLPLGRPARPAPLPGGVPRRRDARGAAHWSLLSWRGAQRRHTRLAVPEAM